MVNLGIIFGGKSVEHEISVITYFQVLGAIDLKKYNVYPIYMDKENCFSYSKKYFLMDTFKQNKKIKKNNIIIYNKNNQCYIKKYNNNIYIGKKRIDCFLVLVHGKNLEDGTLSAYLKVLGVPYTSLDNNISSILHDKHYLKIALNSLDIKTVPGYVVYNVSEIKDVSKKKIVKGCSLGSSIGVYVASNMEELKEAVNKCLIYDEKVIVEKKIEKFIEYNQAVYIKNKEVILSSIEQIVPTLDIYSFEGKYESKENIRSLPAKISKDMEKEICFISKKIAKEFNITTVVRIDYIYDLDENVLYVNEINIVPGALSYYLFECRELYFKDLLDDLISNAFKKHYFNEQKVSSFSSNVLNKNANTKFK